MAKARKKAGAGKLLFLLIGLMVLLLGGALFIVLGSDPGEGDALFGGDDDTAVADGDGDGDGPDDDGEQASGGSGRRAVQPASGSADAAVAAAVRGVVRLYRTREPVAGFELTLTRTIGSGEEQRQETLATVSDAEGVFRFDQLEPSGGYALHGEREPYAPVDVPGIALVPTETTDLGTLWLAVPVDLHVTVVSARGEPMKGATVQAFATSSILPAESQDQVGRATQAIVAETAATAEAKTGEDGGAVVKGLRPGRYHVRAVADGFGVASQKNVLVAPEQKRPPLRLVLFPGHVLTGLVTDVDGAPVEGASVIAAPVSYGTAKFDKIIATSQASGAYRIAGLAPGRYVMYLAPTESAVVVGSQIGIPETTRYDFRLRPTATLFGTISDEDGNPIADAEVAYASQGGRPVSARTGEDGGYRIEDVPAGPSQYFRVKADGFVPFPEPGTPQQGQGESLREGGEVRRDMALRRGTTALVTVRTEGAGKPIEGARVTMHMAQLWGQGQGTQTATTDARGVASLTGLIAGPHLVVAQAAGHVQPDLPTDFANTLRNPGAMPPRWRVDVPSEGTVEIDVRLSAGASVSGVVKTPDGDPVEGVQVTVTGARPLVPVFTDTAGAFTVTSVPAHGRAVATALPVGRPATNSEPFKVEAAGAVTEIEIELTGGGTIRGKVRSPDGGPLDGAIVRFVTGKLQDNNAWNFNQFNQREVHPVQADGTFVIEGVPTGAITVRADAEGYLPAWDNTVEVSEDQETGGIDLIVKRAVELTGRVESPDGRPVAGATITANYMGTEQNRRWGFVSGLGGQPIAQSDAEGLFALRGLEPGKYGLNANAPGYTPSPWRETQTGAGDVLLTLGLGERISGILKDDAGQAMAGIPVQAAKSGEGNNRNRLGWGGRGGGNGPRVFSAGDGTFEFTDLAEGAYDLTVSAAWIWGRDVNVEDTVKQGVRTGTDDVEIVVKSGQVIEGRVIDDQEEPVSVGWVYGQFVASGGNNWASRRWARLGPDGSFRLTGLKPGTYNLNAYGDFVQSSKQGVSSGATGVEFEVRRGMSIAGTFVDEDGLAPPNAPNVQARPTGEEKWQGKEIIVTSGGDFVVTGFEAGAYDVRFQAWNRAPVILTNVAAGTSGLTVSIVEGLAINGFVVDGTGSPLKQVWVSATQLGVQPGTVASNGNARTDEAGKFDIKGLLAGEYRLYLRGGNLAPKVVEPVAAGADGQRIVMDAGLPITGMVKDPSGNPVRANLQLRLGTDQLGWTRCDTEGRFTFQNAPSSGTFAIQVWANVDGKQFNFSHDDVEAGATDLEIVLKE